MEGMIQLKCNKFIEMYKVLYFKNFRVMLMKII